MTRSAERPAPFRPAEEARQSGSFELLAGETRQHLEATDDTASQRRCYYKGCCGGSPQARRITSILAPITSRRFFPRHRHRVMPLVLRVPVKYPMTRGKPRMLWSPLST